MYFWPKNGRNRQNKNFPRHSTAIQWLNDSKHFSQVSDQVLDKSDVRFWRKCPKTWLLSKNDQTLDKKGSKNGPDFFFQNKKFHLPFLNNKLSLNNKN